MLLHKKVIIASAPAVTTSRWSERACGTTMRRPLRAVLVVSSPGAEPIDFDVLGAPGLPVPPDCAQLGQPLLLPCFSLPLLFVERFRGPYAGNAAAPILAYLSISDRMSGKASGDPPIGSRPSFRTLFDVGALERLSPPR